MILVNCFRKSVFILDQLFLRVPLSTPCQTYSVVTKRVYSKVVSAGYRACSGRPLWWVRPGVGVGFYVGSLRGPVLY